MTTQARTPYRPLEAGDPRHFAAPRELDVLIPTRDRPAELAATLAGLAGQELGEQFGVVVSDQSETIPGWMDPAVGGLVRALRYRGNPVLLRHHLPRRGMAEQRAFLLRSSLARYVLYLDDDVWLEPRALARLLTAMRELRCGFVGNAPHGLSYLGDHRPEQQDAYQEWVGRPRPELIQPRGPEWARADLHSAANLAHVTEKLGLRDGEWRAYKVAWVGACVLFDRTKLLAVGGFDFWPTVPADHEGEDVVAQLRVLSRYGGAGVLPSGAYHLESPTTVTDRRVECFDLVPTVAPPRSGGGLFRGGGLLRRGARFRPGTARVRLGEPAPVSGIPEEPEPVGRVPAEATVSSEKARMASEQDRRRYLNELTDAVGVYSTDGQVDDPTGNDAGDEEEFGHGRRPRPDRLVEPEQRRRPSPDGRIGPS